MREENAVTPTIGRVAAITANQKQLIQYLKTDRDKFNCYKIGYIFDSGEFYDELYVNAGPTMIGKCKTRDIETIYYPLSRTERSYENITNQIHQLFDDHDLEEAIQPAEHLLELFHVVLQKTPQVLRQLAVKKQESMITIKLYLSMKKFADKDDLNGEFQKFDDVACYLNSSFVNQLRLYLSRYVDQLSIMNLYPALLGVDYLPERPIYSMYFELVDPESNRIKGQLANQVNAILKYSGFQVEPAITNVIESTDLFLRGVGFKDIWNQRDGIQEIKFYFDDIQKFREE